MSPGSAVSKTRYGRLINDFLDNVSYRHPDIKWDSEMESRLKKSLRTEGIPDNLLQRIQPRIMAAVAITQSAYSFLPSHSQDILAIWAALTISIDDLGPDITIGLQRYSDDLLNGRKHADPLFEATTNWLRKNCQYFGKFGGDMIFKSTIDFFCACYHEPKMYSDVMPTDAPEFTEYFRYKSGAAEGYAFILFPEEIFPEQTHLNTYLPAVPYLIQFMNFGNDLFSFYKEEMQSDRQNYIHARVQSEGISPVQALELTAERTVALFHKIRAIVSGNLAVQQAIDGFLHGYLLFHLGSSRYRLQELDIPAAKRATETLER
ncbi:hypothetical protein N7461_007157 [Penicillium sp. DV-2018c]|nr:hypothetical protein N7461_007157 [Penicillium sp. DV-2018c]